MSNSKVIYIIAIKLNKQFCESLHEAQRFANKRRLGFRSHLPINPLLCLSLVFTFKFVLSPSLFLLAVCALHEQERTLVVSS